MKANKARTLFMAIVFLATASNINAEDTFGVEVPETTGENVVINSSPLSSYAQELLEQKRIAELEETEQNKESDPLEVGGLAIPIKNHTEETKLSGLAIPIKNHTEDTKLSGLAIPIKNHTEEIQLSGLMIPIKNQNELCGLAIPIKNHSMLTLTSDQMNATAVSYSPYVYHWVDSFPQDNIVKMEDSSEWLFDKTDIDTVRLWHPGDTIVIAPKSSLWGSNYTYVLMNKDNGSSVAVNPFLGPVEFGKYTNWIAGKDPSTGQVYVFNGQGERSVWEIANTDLEFFREWQVNDTIIIGENNSWLWSFSSCNYIIINVNMNHYVRARQVAGSSSY